MKLELKHLAPYLPYKLRCEVLNIGKEKEIGEMMAVYDDGSACFANIVESEHGFEYVKPVLQPLSDLDSYFKPLWDKKDGDVLKWLDSDRLYYFDDLRIEDIEVRNPEYLPVGLFQLLVKHHFDIFGLIEKGLAIDINTLK